jgi:hypothetical protein
MINYVNKQTAPRMCRQTEREQHKFIQVAQPLIEQETSAREEAEERLRPNDSDVNSIRDQPALEQVGQPQHALLVVQAIVRNQ